MKHIKENFMMNIRKKQEETKKNLKASRHQFKASDGSIKWILKGTLTLNLCHFGNSERE